MDTKKELRHGMLRIRREMSQGEVVTKSSIICNKIINSKIYKDSSTVFCYCSINNEVDLSPLMDHILSNKKTLALPKVTGNNLTFYRVSSLDQTQKGYCNIPEPVTDTVVSLADLIIVPGVAFTKSGNRLGYGGGFYDRYLTINHIFSIGVCYDFQITDSMPVDEHDIRIKKIITN